jgi:hypothetical protein
MACAPALEFLEGRRDVLSAPDFQHFDFDAEFMGCCLNLSGLMDRDGVANVGDDCQSMRIRDHCANSSIRLPGSSIA